MIVSPHFEDVSKDAKYAINANLSVYDIRGGCKIMQIKPPASMLSADAGGMQLRVRFSDDNRYVIALDRSDDTLHLFALSLDVTTQRHLCSCYTHAPNTDLAHGLEVRHHGRAVTIRNADNAMVFLIRDPSATDKHLQISYNNEISWMTSQFASVVPTANSGNMRHGTQAMAATAAATTTAGSVYERREILMKAESDAAGDVRVIEQFRKKESSKPSVLLIAGPLLGGFRAKRFSHHLDVQKVSTSLSRSVSWVQDAVAQLTSIRMRYDCVILHPLADDVRRLGVAKVAEYVDSAVNAALQRAEAVVLSLPPPRQENTPEMTQKCSDLLALLRSAYGSSRKVTLCDNANLSADAKALVKHFRDQSSLSADGLTQLSVNLKQATFRALKDDNYIKTKLEQGLL